MTKTRAASIAALFILICAAAAAEQANSWYDKPVRLAQGWHAIDTVAPGVSAASVHVRCAPVSNRASAFALCWNYVDDRNYNCARMSISSKSGIDDVYYDVARITAEQCVDGITAVLADINLDKDDKYVSLKLVYDGLGARLYCGCAEQELVAIVPYDNAIGGIVGIMADGSLMCQRITCLWDKDSDRQMCQFHTMDELDEHLARQLDSIEGIWEYLDRDITESYASLGGKYRVAIVKNADGDYDVAYLSGAANNAQGWVPLQIKGRLHPTIFVGDYDLVWIDADGNVLDDDNNAQLSSDFALLTLNFPVYKSKMRLRRVPLSHR